jgi:hypothetical protein
MRGLDETIPWDSATRSALHLSIGNCMAEVNRYCALKIGWHFDEAGRLVPIDEEETRRWSNAVSLLREAYLDRMRKKGILPPKLQT